MWPPSQRSSRSWARWVAGPRHGAWGVGATMLVGGLGGGAAIGGVMVRASSQGPTVAFVIGAACCVLTAVAAWVGSGVLDRAAPRLERTEEPSRDPVRPLWPSLIMAASDRATGAVLTAVFAGFLAKNLGYDAAERGFLVGLPLILMALGAAPAGWVADRLGALHVRSACAVAYAICFSLVAWVGLSTAQLSVVLLVLGVAAAPLLPASLSLASRAGRGTAGLAAFRTAGDAGYFLGIVTVVAVGAWAGGDLLTTQRGLMVGFGLLHLACTVATAIAGQRGACEGSGRISSE